MYALTRRASNGNFDFGQRGAFQHKFSLRGLRKIGPIPVTGCTRIQKYHDYPFASTLSQTLFFPASRFFLKNYSSNFGFMKASGGGGSKCCRPFRIRRDKPLPGMMRSWASGNATREAQRWEEECEEARTAPTPAETPE